MLLNTIPRSCPLPPGIPFACTPLWIERYNTTTVHAVTEAFAKRYRCKYTKQTWSRNICCCNDTWSRELIYQTDPRVTIHLRCLFLTWLLKVLIKTATRDIELPHSMSQNLTRLITQVLYVSYSHFTEFAVHVVWRWPRQGNKRKIIVGWLPTYWSDSS